MPLCLSNLLGEALVSSGVTIHYSLEADNDDTLAAFAQASTPYPFPLLTATARHCGGDIFSVLPLDPWSTFIP